MEENDDRIPTDCLDISREALTNHAIFSGFCWRFPEFQPIIEQKLEALCGRTKKMVLKSNVVLYQTPTGSVYKTLDIASGNMCGIEAVDSGVYIKLANINGKDETVQAVHQAIQISKNILHDFEPTHRHVMLYTSLSEDQLAQVNSNRHTKNEHASFQISCEYISGNSLQNLISSLDDGVISMHVIQSYTW